ncbi:hypothetical protein EYF80_044186 [Liparis tanakae]|uniref:Uncharacterized protein n=1 Tax=Liparis tanakae TaxID=230148 RepID=A0A4Z2FWH3_9TELE|nr:hypothetical protein EYF80_044186 [Liparis tanakae]
MQERLESHKESLEERKEVGESQGGGGEGRVRVGEGIGGESRRGGEVDKGEEGVAGKPGGRVEQVEPPPPPVNRVPSVDEVPKFKSYTRRGCLTRSNVRTIVLVQMGLWSGVIQCTPHLMWSQKRPWVEMTLAAVMIFLCVIIIAANS